MAFTIAYSNFNALLLKSLILTKKNMTIFRFQKKLKTLPTVEDLPTALDSSGAWVTTPGQVLLPTVYILPTLPDSTDKNHHK